MSNRANLISDNNPTPAFEDENGNRSFEISDAVSEGGSYILPFFWLTAFRESNAVAQKVGEDTFTCLVAPLGDALKNLEASKELVCSEFSNPVFHWPRWEEIVRCCKGAYLKIDATEIWGMEPSAYENNLVPAISWFTSGQESDRDALLELCGFNLDFKTKSLRLNNSLVTGNHLYGFV